MSAIETTKTDRPWLKPNGGSFTTGAGLAGYLRELADAIEGIGEISPTAVCLGFQPSSYETDPDARVAAVDAVASALGMSASLTHMAGSTWHYTTVLGAHAVNVYSRVDGPTCTWVGSYGCQEEQSGNPEGLCAAHLETLRDDIAAAEALLAQGSPAEQVAADAAAVLATVAEPVSAPKHVAVDDWTCSCGWKVDGFTAPEFAAEKLAMKHIDPANAEVQS